MAIYNKELYNLNHIFLDVHIPMYIFSRIQHMVLNKLGYMMCVHKTSCIHSYTVNKTLLYDNIVHIYVHKIIFYYIQYIFTFPMVPFNNMAISVGYSWSYRTFLTINTFIRTLMTTWQNISTYIFTFVIFNRIITLIKLRNKQTD